MSDQDAGAVSQDLSYGAKISTLLRHDDSDAQGFEEGKDFIWRAEIGLGQADERLHSGVVSRHEAPIDQTCAGWRVGERSNDHELVGVGDDDALDRVVIVGRAAQHGAAGEHFDDTGEAAFVAADVADDSRLVTDYDALRPRFLDFMAVIVRSSNVTV